MATYTVVTAGGGNYTSLEAAINGIGNLTENTLITLDSTGADDTTAATVDSVLGGYTLTITNVGAAPYRLVTTTNYGQSILVTVACTITGIDVTNSGTDGNGLRNNATGAVVKDSIFRYSTLRNILDYGTNNVYVNSFIYGGTVGFYKAASGSHVYGYNLSISGASTYGVQALAYRNIYLKNSYSGGSGTADLFEADANSHIIITTSYTEDGTLSTPTAAYSTSAGGYFTNVTATTEDLHIGASSTLIGNGTDLSGDATYSFTTDYDGDTRSAWDIGADEYVAAGGAFSPWFAVASTVTPQYGGQ